MVIFDTIEFIEQRALTPENAIGGNCDDKHDFHDDDVNHHIVMTENFETLTKNKIII